MVNHVLSMLGVIVLCSTLHLLGDSVLLILWKLGLHKGKNRSKIDATLLFHCLYADSLVALYVAFAYSPYAALLVIAQHYVIDIVLNVRKTKALALLDQGLHILSILTIIGAFA